MIVETMILDLLAAGWVPMTSYVWKSPSGEVYLGPVGAWKAMKENEEDGGAGGTAS